MRRILLLAPTGQVGFELQRSLALLGTLSCLSRAEVDFSDLAATEQRVLALAPDLIVNAAAWTAVDAAETETVAAYRLNAELPAMLAAVSRRLGSLLVHYSTDYVYPGDGDGPWQEHDNPAPLSVYGASKLAGDQAIINSGIRYLIFRTSWVYAARGRNFMKTMLQLAMQRDSLAVVHDQIGAPTPARLIADTTAQILQLVFTQPENRSGVYHLASAGHTSWYGFADAIFQLAREAGIRLKLAEGQLSAIPGSAYPTPARRPANSRLDLSKIERTFGVVMPHWQSQLALTFAEYAEHLKGQAG